MNPTAIPAYKRKILVIKKQFQYKFILMVMACVAVAIALIAVDMFTSLGRYAAEASPGLDMHLVYQDSFMAFVVKCVIYLGGVFVVAMVVSNRVAGPLYRFEKSIDKVAEGDLSMKVFLRKGDELEDHRDSLNDMIESLREKVAKDVSKAAGVKAVLEDLSRTPDLPAEAAQKVRKALSDVSDIGKGFKLS